MWTVCKQRQPAGGSSSITSSSTFAFWGAEINMSNNEVTVAGYLFKRGAVKVKLNYLDAGSMDAIALGGEPKGEKRYLLLHTVYKCDIDSYEDFDFWLFIADREISFDHSKAAIQTQCIEWREESRLYGFSTSRFRPLRYSHAHVTIFVDTKDHKDNCVTRLMRTFNCNSIEYQTAMENLMDSTLADLPDYAKLDALKPGVVLYKIASQGSGGYARGIEPDYGWIKKVKEAEGKTAPDPKIEDLVAEQAVKDGVVDSAEMQKLIDKVNSLPAITCPENRSAIIQQLERAVALLKDVDESYAREQQLVEDLKESNDKLERMATVLKNPAL